MSENYADFSDAQPTETAPLPTEAGQDAAAKALAEIRSRSFAGRHPELGRMINCQFCSLRHRENERKCSQTFAKTEEGVVYGELTPPEGLTKLTARQVLGAQRFAKKRINPHSNRWASARANALVVKQKKAVKEENAI
jgi:hypothetical protein